MTKRSATTRGRVNGPWLTVFALAFPGACNARLAQPAHPGLVDGNGPEHPHHPAGHEEHSAPGATVLADGVRATFEAMESAAHLAMAEQMGIKWKPEPDADYHLSVVLTGADDSQPMRDLSVLLSITDPAGHRTQKQAQVMSAGAMYHY